MLTPEPSTQFKKDLKKFKYQQNIIDDLDEIIEILCKKEKPPVRCRDHGLIGDYVNHRELHVKPDILLIYFTDETYLYLVRIGSHSELF